MGSRIMHYDMAVKLQAKYHFNDYFLLGSIAPDNWRNSGIPRAQTHFTVPTMDGENRVVLQHFLQKYASLEHDDFKLGYYFHLLADLIWFDHVYHKYVLKNGKYVKEEALKYTYRDFRSYNYLIIKQDKLKPFSLPQLPQTGIDEIIDQDLTKIIADLNSDFVVYSKTEPNWVPQKVVAKYLTYCKQQFSQQYENGTLF